MYDKSRFPYDPKGGGLQTDVPEIALDRAHLAHFQVSAADAVGTSNTGIHAAVTLGAEAQEITTAITNPAVPRSLIVKGNAAGIIGNVVFEGTNFANEPITETIALNGSTAVEGSKAFKTVTKYTLPPETHAGTDTVSVGWGDKLGLPYKLPFNTVLAAYLGGVKEAAAPAVATSGSALESNTSDLNSALNGTVVDILMAVW